MDKHERKKLDREQAEVFWGTPLGLGIIAVVLAGGVAYVIVSSITDLFR